MENVAAPQGCSCAVAGISACHADDLRTIPGRGVVRMQCYLAMLVHGHMHDSSPCGSSPRPGIEPGTSA